MAFSYQKNFGLPTENVSHELMSSLLRDHNAAWMVDKIIEELEDGLFKKVVHML
jgi:hypothetical protein